ncbi:MAG: beta-N-acetylhexosaminidase [Nitrospirae bacterium]|nr:beta-N-acetylhexosaminidase [Nitrospirota bacterium]MBI3352076.1 beta-N-acetylhexosaminidase [Nitrospirota bacterium]
MDLKERVGQLLMVGFDGYAPSKEVLTMIKKYRVGGVILFKRNIQSLPQLVKLTQELQKASPETPLLIGIDQEGGSVSRLSGEFTVFPPMAVIGSHNSVPLAYSVGEVTARELKAVGIHLNFAPVLDINSNKKNPVIGDRAFGDTPSIVSKLGLAVIMGHQDNGVIACGKHFPGHGDTSTDSHKTLPEVEHGLERLLDFELRPFQHAVANRLEALMTAHILFTKIDPEKPASLSKKIVTSILREGMNYDGLVMSDDLEMQAILDHYSVKDAAVKAILAGSDIVLVCHKFDLQEQAWDGLFNASSKGTISEKRLEQSLNRISKIKEKYVLSAAMPRLKQAQEIVGQEFHKETLSKVLTPPKKNLASSVS